MRLDWQRITSGILIKTRLGVHVLTLKGLGWKSSEGFCWELFVIAATNTFFLQKNVLQDVHMFKIYKQNLQILLETLSNFWVFCQNFSLFGSTVFLAWENRGRRDSGQFTCSVLAEIAGALGSLQDSGVSAKRGASGSNCAVTLVAEGGNEKNLGSYRLIYPQLCGIIIVNHKKDPYETIRLQWKVRDPRGFFACQVVSGPLKSWEFLRVQTRQPWPLNGGGDFDGW